jgi:putative RecB family exonuclease
MVIVPTPQTDEALHLSASSITTMTECPREFLFKYIQGRKPQDTGASLVFGSALHEALAYFYNALRQSQTEPTLAELCDVAVTALTTPRETPISFTRGETLESLKSSTVGLLKAFLATGIRPDHILAVEHRFMLPLTNPLTGQLLPESLLGTFDLLIEYQGRVCVLDHKSCARLDPDRTRSPDLQMSLYSHAAKQLLGVSSVDLQYQFLVKTKDPTVTTLPIARQDEAREERAALMQAASASFWISTALSHDHPELVLPKRPSWRCATCGFRSHCASCG